MRLEVAELALSHCDESTGNLIVTTLLTPLPGFSAIQRKINQVSLKIKTIFGVEQRID